MVGQEREMSNTPSARIATTDGPSSSGRHTRPTSVPEVASMGRVEAGSRFMPTALTPRLRLGEEYILPVGWRVLQRSGLGHEVHEGADAADLVVVLDIRIGQDFRDVI